MLHCEKSDYLWFLYSSLKNSTVNQVWNKNAHIKPFTMIINKKLRKTVVFSGAKDRGLVNTLPSFHYSMMNGSVRMLLFKSLPLGIVIIVSS